MARTPPAKPHNTGTHLPIGGLTALRGLAALYVASYHHLGNLGVPAPLYKGYLAVDFFFLLSGFIIMHAYGAVFSNAPTWSHYKTFLLLRLGRIYPVHLLAMVVLSVVGLFLAENPFNVISLSALGNVLLVQAWGFFDSRTWNGPAWSLSVEWACYLLFPLLCWLLKRTASPVRKIILYALSLLLLQSLVFLHPLHSLDITFDFALARAIPEFLQGMLLYQLYQSNRGRIHADLAMIFAGVCLLFIICTRLRSTEPLVLLPMALVILVAARNQGLCGKALNSRPFVFLGEISLSIYLLHVPFFFILMSYTKIILMLAPEGWHLAAATLNAVLYYGLLIALSRYTYLHLEVPVRNFARKKLAQEKMIGKKT